MREPRRLRAYRDGEEAALILLLLLLLLFATASCSSGRPPWADGRMVRKRIPAREPRPEYDDFEARLLALHNRERAELRIPPLVWDVSLAAAAGRYG
jgi:uncharacterized protein YkwD